MKDRHPWSNSTPYSLFTLKRTHTWAPLTVLFMVTLSFLSQKHANGGNLYAGSLTPFQRKRKSEVSSSQQHSHVWLSMKPSTACLLYDLCFYEVPVRPDAHRLHCVSYSKCYCRTQCPFSTLKQHHHHWHPVAFTTNGLTYLTYCVYKAWVAQGCRGVMKRSLTQACVSLSLLLSRVIVT